MEDYLKVLALAALPAGHEGGEPRFDPLALMSGFAHFALISTYFEA